MVEHELPRFFLPSAHDVDGPEIAPTEPSFVLDSFVMVAAGAAPREVMVGLDGLGALVACDLDAREAHLASIRQHLAHAEVRDPVRRRLDVATGGLWLFAIELLEQLPDAPGANDPVYLYGTLWPAGDPSAPGVRGQLTTTRGDILRGLVEGARWAFRYPPDEAERVPQALHLLLPGDRAEVVAAGRGLVLAYPALDPELLGSHAGNELQALAFFYDVLAALGRDADHGAAPDGDVLPVPDVTGFVKDLVDDGWVISEDARTATREAGDAGFFRRLFSGRETLELPAQASVADYVRRATAALARLEGWPTAASQALFARVAPWTGALLTPTAPVPKAPARTPAAPTVATPPAPPAPRPPAGVRAADRSEWMRDFVSEHAARRPQLSTVKPPRPPAPFSRPGRPDWMKDFD